MLLAANDATAAFKTIQFVNFAHFSDFIMFNEVCSQFGRASRFSKQKVKKKRNILTIRARQKEKESYSCA